jgi:hypothetical protein
MYLSGKQKARMITLTVIVLYLLYGILAYAWEIRMQTPQIDAVDSMQIDGSEFAGIANLFVAGTNGFVSFITMILSVMAMIVIALILLVPWRCIAIRRQSVIAREEYVTAKYLWIGFCVCAWIGGFIIMRFTNMLYLLLMTGILAFLIWIFSVWPLGRRINEENS